MSAYKIEDTSCGHCVTMIEKTVKTVGPAADAACDLPSKTVAITGAQNEDLILQALRDAGYPAVQA